MTWCYTDGIPQWVRRSPFISPPVTSTASVPVNSPPKTAPWFAAFVQAVDVRVWRVLWWLTESALTLLAFLLAYIVRYQLEWFKDVEPSHIQSFAVYLPSALGLLGIQFFVFQMAGVYHMGRNSSWLHAVFVVASASTLSILVLIIAHLFFNPLLYSRLVFLYTALGMTILLGVFRLGLHGIRRYLHSQGVGVERVLLVGTGELGLMVMRNIVAMPDLGWQLLGFLRENGNEEQGDIGRFKMLGPVSRLATVIRELHPDKVIICLSWQNYLTVERALKTCRQAGVPTQVVPNLFQVTRNQIMLETLNGVPLLSEQPISIAGWNYWLKRVEDLILFAVLLVPAGLVGLLIALAIWLESGGPVIYSQTRIGRNQRPFRVFKFRTMINNADAIQENMADLNMATGAFFKIKNDPRCTRVGRLLRSFSLDEIPQIVNVLKGEMSFIGPRPGLPGEVEQYQDWHLKRLAVMPGISGLWQVSGRSDLTFDEMVLLDIYYAENWNPGLDAHIVLRTIPAMLFRRGAY